MTEASLTPPPDAPALSPRQLALRRWQRRLGEGRATWQLFIRQPLAVIGLSLIVLFAVISVLHPILMRTVWNKAVYDPLVGFDAQGGPHPALPSARHWLGTDTQGRDVMSQLLFAATPSFGVGLLAGLVAAATATAVGVLSAYFGGAVDVGLMGLTDLFIVLPPTLILLVVGLMVQLSWPQLALIYGVFAGLGGPAIVLRAHALSIKLKPYVEASRVAGGNNWHILRTHVFPAMIPLMLLILMFTVTGAVLAEALLSFFGRTQVRMSWGTMIWYGQNTFRAGAGGGQWHAILPPAIALMLFCGAFYMIGRAFDEMLNPRLKKR
jgi:peptide/nickel transport system permease protein